MRTDGLDSILPFPLYRQQEKLDLQRIFSVLYFSIPGRYFQINKYYAIIITIIITFGNLKRQQTSVG